MNGRRALIYARVRENKLDPADNDITRGERQQAVIQAIADEVTSFRTFLRMPFIGDELVAPLATDLSANQFLQLGWVKRRTPASGIAPLPPGRHARRHRRRSRSSSEARTTPRSSRWSRARSRRSAPRPGSGTVRPRLPRRPRRLAAPAGARRVVRTESAAFGSEAFGSGLSAFFGSSRVRRRRRRPSRPRAGSRGRSPSSRSPSP